MVYVAVLCIGKEPRGCSHTPSRAVTQATGLLRAALAAWLRKGGRHWTGGISPAPRIAAAWAHREGPELPCPQPLEPRAGPGPAMQPAGRASSTRHSRAPAQPGRLPGNQGDGSRPAPSTRARPAARGVAPCVRARSRPHRGARAAEDSPSASSAPAGRCPPGSAPAARRRPPPRSPLLPPGARRGRACSPLPSERCQPRGPRSGRLRIRAAPAAPGKTPPRRTRQQLTPGASLALLLYS